MHWGGGDISIVVEHSQCTNDIPPSQCTDVLPNAPHTCDNKINFYREASHKEENTHVNFNIYTTYLQMYIGGLG